MPTKRVFLAISLDPEIKQKVEALKKQPWLNQLPIKLVEPENSHIAIKFLDELTDPQIKLISSAINQLIKSIKPFKVTIENVLIFPNLHQPRVITLKVLSDELVKLGQTIIKELEKFSFITPEHRSYLPHLTLGRINDFINKSLMEKIYQIEFNSQQIVNQLTLYQSQLTSQGPLYTVLKTFPLV